MVLPTYLFSEKFQPDGGLGDLGATSCSVSGVFDCAGA